MSDATSDPLAAIDRALLYLRGRMRPRGHKAPDHDCGPPQVEFIPLLYAIATEGEVTVGKVAEWMCVDPSRASRMVTSAIESGQVTRLASQADGRRTVLELTDAGRQVLASAEEYRQTQYAQIMADWSERERQEFARLLTKFAEEFA